jgi:ABC-type phosphate transport system substrate-binding protein
MAVFQSYDECKEAVQMSVARELNKKRIFAGTLLVILISLCLYSGSLNASQIDEISVIVHIDNPVRELSSSQLQDIFTGKITNWSALGGPDMKIRPLIVKQSSATRQVFKQQILGDSDYEGCTMIAPDSRIVTTVSRDKAAIGQISAALIKEEKSVINLKIDGGMITDSSR